MIPALGAGGRGFDSPLAPFVEQAFLAQMVERWPFKPMVVGSIPTEGGFTKTTLHQPHTLRGARTKDGGQGGIEPPTSPTLKENHTTRPLALIDGYGSEQTPSY